jgi:hypothetical protein
MRRGERLVGSLLLGIAFLLPLATVGCAEHHYYRVYDPVDNNYHRWDSHEQVYYHQWAVETHRDTDRDYRKLDKDDQKQYWDWRHHHAKDKNHGHDHDNDRQ